MISKQQIKFINSLKYNKYRLKHNCFVAEGVHLVSEFLQSNFSIKNIFSTKEYIDTFQAKCDVVTPKELSKISFLKNSSCVLSIISRPIWNYDKKYLVKQKKIIILDSISDPGNMGTIIRTADWYGINTIYVSKNCVDVFSPKVVQSTMGSLSRVKIYSVDVVQIIQDLKKIDVPCYGATLSGKSVYSIKKPSNLGLVFGSESHGISAPVLDVLDEEIVIPAKNHSIDSLNVSVAFGIILSEFG